MTIFPAHLDIIYISKLKASQIDCANRTEHIRDTHGHKLQQMVLAAASRRHELATLFLSEATRLMNATPPMYRLAISRLYYSMYHNIRSCVFIAHSGDDHEEHSKLPTKEIDGFDDTIDWKTMLKEARLSRNNADYDIHPIDDTQFKASAEQLASHASQINDKCLAFLTTKGAMKWHD